VARPSFMELANSERVGASPSGVNQASSRWARQLRVEDILDQRGGQWVLGVVGEDGYVDEWEEGHCLHGSFHPMTKCEM
jgi:hypothetical protein